MSHENNGLIAVERSEVVVTFLLEGGIANGKDFVEEEDVAFGANGN